ncbi:INO80 complex subunit B-like isoform X2 [Amphibalanus amphitrite]|uniref:INO80 complex subunit B-like isoform X2 n=1 Tax=Amphibalanus amphitrite TaxID=1232801 RepID=UPI001C90E481|nr:INO80 complex subunit B-like isoform X2 [Amphibalanus amphitrite]
MEFDEDDFIFIESDTPAEQLETLTPPRAEQPKHQPAYGKHSSLDDAEPSTSKPKLKRSFRTSPEPQGLDLAGQSRPGTSGKKKKKGADPDSEEERWLDALEEGNLEQVDDELKKMRNPLLMTARQRALLDKRSGDDSMESFPAEPLLALPSGYREKTEMTAEMVERHKKKTERRREQAKKHREEEKKKTVSRLLNKSESRAGRGAAKAKAAAAAAAAVPAIVYRQTVTGSELRLPVGVAAPITAQPPRAPPKPRLCGVAGCSNPRRYSCSVTGVPLCSLECFRAIAAQRARTQKTPTVSVTS